MVYGVPSSLRVDEVTRWAARLQVVGEVLQKAAQRGGAAVTAEGGHEVVEAALQRRVGGAGCGARARRRTGGGRVAGGVRRGAGCYARDRGRCDALRARAVRLCLQGGRQTLDELLE